MAHKRLLTPLFLVMVSSSRTNNWWPVTAAHKLTNSDFGIPTWDLAPSAQPYGKYYAKVMVHDGVHIGESELLEFVILEGMEVPGDTNGDNLVNLADYHVIQSCMGDAGQPIGNEGCLYLDLDGDFDVDAEDLAIFQKAYYPNPDTNFDLKVTFLDFAILSNKWLEEGCNARDAWCERADINRDSSVDFLDVREFSIDWD